MKHVSTVAIILLAILALLSAVSIAMTTTNYEEGIGAVGNLRFELSDLVLTEEDEPTVAISFYIENISPLAMRLESMHFSIFLNGEFMGSNYEPFTERALDGLEETTLHFRIPLQPFYLQYVKKAREEEKFSWSLRGSAKLVLPFRENVVMLTLRESWSGE